MNRPNYFDFVVANSGIATKATTSQSLEKDKLIIANKEGVRRNIQIYGQRDKPVYFKNLNYDPEANPMSWENIQRRRSDFDPLMEGGKQS